MPIVLIVDDEPRIIRSLERSLKSFGWTVLGAEGPHEAGVLQLDADVILTDWRMSGGGGARVVENALRPVVIFTGSPQDVPTDLETPVLPKPVSTKEIDGTLRRAIEQNTNRRRKDR